MIQYLLTNFGCGNGPFLRAVDLAMAVRERLLTRLGNQDEIRVLIPYAYGEKMRTLLGEDYADALGANPSLFVFDEALGLLLKRLLYDGRDFQFTLEALANEYPDVQRLVDEHLSVSFEAVTFGGERVTISPSQMLASVSRNPNVRMGSVLSFYTSIGFLEKIFVRTMEDPSFSYDRVLMEKARQHARSLEDGQALWFQPEPSAFSFETPRDHWRPETIWTSPLFHPPESQTFADDLAPGVYVLVSGIPHLERLYDQVTKYGWTFYANQPLPHLKAARLLHPRFVGHPSIQAVFARAAWNTIWLTNLSRKPLLCPSFLKDDFPEIFFNNKTVEALGLGTILMPDTSVEDAVKKSVALQPAIDDYYSRLRSTYGTMDGLELVASQISKRLLS